MTTIESTTDAPPEVQAVQQLFQIATGYMASAALQTVLKLQIPDRVAAGTTAVKELARDAGVDEDALYRVMRALASLGHLRGAHASHVCADARRPACCGRAPGSFYDMGLWITSPFHFRVYAEMLHAVTTGTAGRREGGRHAGVRVSRQTPTRSSPRSSTTR